MLSVGAASGVVLGLALGLPAPHDALAGEFPPVFRHDGPLLAVVWLVEVDDDPVVRLLERVSGIGVREERGVPALAPLRLEDREPSVAGGIVRGRRNEPEHAGVGLLAILPVDIEDLGDGREVGGVDSRDGDAVGGRTRSDRALPTVSHAAVAAQPTTGGRPPRRYTGAAAPRTVSLLWWPHHCCNAGVED